MKFVNDRPFADPDGAARKLMELAHAFEPVQDGRIYIEKINEPFLYQLKGTPAEYKAGLERAIANGWLALHESGRPTLSSASAVCPTKLKYQCAERRMNWLTLGAGA